MYTPNVWHSHYISMHKVIVILIFCTTSFINAFAQREGFNMLEEETRPYYFGISAGLNNSQYRLFHSKQFIATDSILEVTPQWNAGFQVGINAHYRINSHLALRLNPQFILNQKTLFYNNNYKKDTTLVIESIMLHLPFSFKLSSDRIGNFRFYTIAGPRLDYDFNSNTRSRRNDEVLKIKPLDFGYDIGVGFDIYYPNFIFSPEVKISNGLSNLQKKEDAVPTSKVIDRINTRMIFFGFTIGG
jgi:hypothetical protein